MNLVMEAQDENMTATLAEMDTAKKMAEALHTHYPYHLWGVEVDSQGGIAKVFNLRLSGRWGFIIKLADLYSDPDMMRVVRAGGELLERYKLKRGMFDADAYNALPTDRAGNFIADK